MTTDTSEKGLETLIMRHMTGADGIAVAPNIVAEQRAPYGGTGYIAGSAQDYDRAHALDVPLLFAFLRATQPEAFKKLALADANDPKDITRLVADMVTGKLDVREAAARLPDEALPDTAEDGTNMALDSDAIDEEAIVE
ncbi:MAG: hypothetical protein OEM00_06895 [Burkholderiaceae bacterium]|nr:hypothetical protein [Burkholderiaceae bacterium]